MSAYINNNGLRGMEHHMQNYTARIGAMPGTCGTCECCTKLCNCIPCKYDFELPIGSHAQGCKCECCETGCQCLEARAKHAMKTGVAHAHNHAHGHEMTNDGHVHVQGHDMAEHGHIHFHNHAESAVDHLGFMSNIPPNNINIPLAPPQQLEPPPFTKAMRMLIGEFNQHPSNNPKNCICDFCRGKCSCQLCKFCGLGYLQIERQSEATRNTFGRFVVAQRICNDFQEFNQECASFDKTGKRVMNANSLSVYQAVAQKHHHNDVYDKFLDEYIHEWVNMGEKYEKLLQEYIVENGVINLKDGLECVKLKPFQEKNSSDPYPAQQQMQQFVPALPSPVINQIMNLPVTGGHSHGIGNHNAPHAAPVTPPNRAALPARNTPSPNKSPKKGKTAKEPIHHQLDYNVKDDKGNDMTMSVKQVGRATKKPGVNYWLEKGMPPPDEVKPRGRSGSARKNKTNDGDNSKSPKVEKVKKTRSPRKPRVSPKRQREVREEVTMENNILDDDILQLNMLPMPQLPVIQQQVVAPQPIQNPMFNQQQLPSPPHVRSQESTKNRDVTMGGIHSQWAIPVGFQLDFADELLQGPEELAMTPPITQVNKVPEEIRPTIESEEVVMALAPAAAPAPAPAPAPQYIRSKSGLCLPASVQATAPAVPTEVTPAAPVFAPSIAPENNQEETEDDSNKYAYLFEESPEQHSTDGTDDADDTPATSAAAMETSTEDNDLPTINKIYEDLYKEISPIEDYFLRQVDTEAGIQDYRPKDYSHMESVSAPERMNDLEFAAMLEREFEQFKPNELVANF